MAQLAIKNGESNTIARMQALAAKGDPAARRWFQTDLWEGYEPPYACFLCDAEIDQITKVVFLPDKKPRKGHQQQMMVSPMCDACNALPAMVRWNRLLKLVKA